MTNHEGGSGQTASNPGGEGSAGSWERWVGAVCALALWAGIFLLFTAVLGNLVFGMIIGTIMLWVVWELAVGHLGFGGWILAFFFIGVIILSLLGGMAAGFLDQAVVVRTLWALLPVLAIVSCVNSVRAARRRSATE